MRQEGFCIFCIYPSLFLQTKGVTYQSRGHQGKAGDGEDGEGHDVDECVMDLTDVSVGWLSCFYIIYSRWSIWDMMEVHPIRSSELIAEECLDLLSLETISIIIVQSWSLMSKED